MHSQPEAQSNVPLKLQLDRLEFRRMRKGDVADGVMPIESVSFGKHHWSDESFFNEMNNQVGRYYVLVENVPAEESASGEPISRVLGYCGFWIIVDEVHVTTLAVHPSLRGNSLGEVLLVHIIERGLSSSVRWITLEVRSGNYSAQNLYYKYGFQSMGVRPKYYQDNQEDALIMTTPDIASAEIRHLHKGLKASLEKRLGGFPKGLGIS